MASRNTRANARALAARPPLTALQLEELLIKASNNTEYKTEVKEFTDAFKRVSEWTNFRQWCIMASFVSHFFAHFDAVLYAIWPFITLFIVGATVALVGFLFSKDAKFVERFVSLDGSKSGLINKRLRFLDFGKLLFSYFIMLIAVLYVSYDASKQNSEYNRVVHWINFMFELFIEAQPLESAVIRFACDYPSILVEAHLTQKTLPGLHRVIAHARLDGDKHANVGWFMDRVHVQNCHGWVLFGYFYALAIVFYIDWLECRVELLRRAEQVNQLKIRLGVRTMIHPDMPLGPMGDRCAPGGTGWNKDKCERVWDMISSPRNTMLNFFTTGSSIHLALSRFLFIFMMMAYVVPTCHLLHTQYVASSMSAAARWLIWNKNPYLNFLAWSPMFWTLFWSAFASVARWLKWIG